MTSDEYKLIADVLRHRMNDLTKLFEDGGFVPKENVPHAMKAQIEILANELEKAFRQRDPMLKHGIFTDAVRDEMNQTMPTEFTLGWVSGVGVDPRR
jgi:hypothetical protein